MTNESLKRYRQAIYAQLNPQRARRRRAYLAADFVPVPAGAPTTARPGTKEKMDVMRMRMILGQALYHPKDA
jgi:hypothetical protein